MTGRNKQPLTQIRTITSKINIPKNHYPIVNYNFERPLNGKKVLCSVVIKISQINIYWNFEKLRVISDRLANLLDKYQIDYTEKSHNGTEDWQFPIINSDDNLQRFKGFIDEYTEYCGKELKIC